MFDDTLLNSENKLYFENVSAVTFPTERESTHAFGTKHMYFMNIILFAV